MKVSPPDSPNASSPGALAESSSAAALPVGESSDSGRVSLVGHTISERYRIDELIAKGGMGAVYRGEHIHMKKQVAIKLLRPETEGFPELVARFQREAIAGAHIDHPNVASATDFGRLPDGSYFLVLEYVRGVTLRQRMKAAPFTPVEAMRVVRQLALALGACHAMNILHRDVKPRNIMLADGDLGRVKLIDFGLAKLPSAGAPKLDPDDEEDTRRSITLKGIIFGTMAYMAPEAALGMDAVDRRSDLYALGIIFYELLTGRHPFDATDSGELFLCQKNVPPPSFKERAPDRSVPKPLERITMRLLEKNPANRYSTAEALVAALDALLDPLAADSTFDGRSVSLVPEQARSLLRRVGSLITSPSLAAGVLPEGIARPKRRLSWAGLATGAALAIGAIALVSPRFHANAPLRAERVSPLFSTASELVMKHWTAERDGNDLQLAKFKKQLHTAAEVKHWSDGAEAILGLAHVESQPHSAPTLEAQDIGPAGTVTLGLAFTENPNAGPVLDALSRDLGSMGVDVLYDISSKHGGARAAKRADALLDKHDVRERATPAVRVALEFRETRCDDKPELFSRVSREGDDRALILLERLRGSTCGLSRCCYTKNEPLNANIRTLKKRLGRE